MTWTRGKGEREREEEMLNLNFNPRGSVGLLVKNCCGLDLLLFRGEKLRGRKKRKSQTSSGLAKRNASILNQKRRIHHRHHHHHHPAINPLWNLIIKSRRFPFLNQGFFLPM